MNVAPGQIVKITGGKYKDQDATVVSCAEKMVKVKLSKSGEEKQIGRMNVTPQNPAQIADRQAPAIVPAPPPATQPTQESIEGDQDAAVLQSTTRPRLEPGELVTITSRTYKNQSASVVSYTAKMVNVIVDGKEVRVSQRSVTRQGQAGVQQPEANVTVAEQTAYAVQLKSATTDEDIEATLKLQDAAAIAARILAGDEEGVFHRTFRIEECDTAAEYEQALQASKHRVGDSHIANKVVVFSTYHRVLNAAQKAFEAALVSHGVHGVDCDGRLDGTVSEARRQEVVRKFTSADSPALLFATTGTGGVGLNLQSANVVMLLDPMWSPALERQALERVWRIGSPHKAVYTYFFRVRDTVDEDFQEIKDEKQIMEDDFYGELDDGVEMASAIETERSILRGTRSAAQGQYAMLDEELKHALRPSSSSCGTGIGFNLYRHQSVGIRWMQRQERGENPLAPGVTGGVLADEMGLGKTVQCLSVVALDVAAGASKPTLIVCPKALFATWQNEAQRFHRRFRVRVWHGSQKTVLKEMIKKAQGSSDVLLTNYDSLRGKLELLLGVEWRRVVLDESHAINNSQNGFDAACKLIADSRWSLSGTPIKNKSKDFNKHLVFIRAPLDSALRGVALRRTKLDVAFRCGLGLPTCYRDASGWRSLTPEERAAYSENVPEAKGFGRIVKGIESTSFVPKMRSALDVKCPDHLTPAKSSMANGEDQPEASSSDRTQAGPKVLGAAADLRGNQGSLSKAIDFSVDVP
eukprot:6182846-Pleurochrysis_carterae.AAC.1